MLNNELRLQSGLLGRLFRRCTSDDIPVCVQSSSVLFCSHVSNDRKLERSKMTSIHPRACPMQSTVIEIYCVASRREAQVSKRIEHCSAPMLGSTNTHRRNTHVCVHLIDDIARQGARESTLQI